MRGFSALGCVTPDFFCDNFSSTCLGLAAQLEFPSCRCAAACMFFCVKIMPFIAATLCRVCFSHRGTPAHSLSFSVEGLPFYTSLRQLVCPQGLPYGLMLQHLIFLRIVPCAVSFDHFLRGSGLQVSLALPVQKQNPLLLIILTLALACC